MRVQNRDMRLTDRQKERIRETAAECFGSTVEVMVFGSRVDDSARGGDIDLLIITDTDGRSARSAKIRFLVKLKQRIGDRHIDVVLQTPDTKESSIHAVAKREGVLLS